MKEIDGIRNALLLKLEEYGRLAYVRDGRNWTVCSYTE